MHSTYRLLRLRNDLYCVEWGVKLYSLTHLLTASGASETEKSYPGFLLTQAFEQLYTAHHERTA